MSKRNQLPYNRQTIDEDDILAVMEVLRSPFITTGPVADKFERALADYVGAKYAVACANGTAALHMCMQALHVGKGDCILTTPITFVADANAGRFVGADVIFADVSSGNINLNILAVRNELVKNPNIKVVIPVHFAGHPVDLEAYAELAKEFGVTIVDDAAHAIGASYLTKSGERVRVGACKHSTMTVFSFHPIKNITTGEGGAITTNDKAIYDLLMALRRHGIINDPHLIQNKELGFSTVNGEVVANPWYYEMQHLGHNYRITDFQCALGLSQLKKLDSFVQRRNELAELYRQLIAQLLPEHVIPLECTPGVQHAYHLFVVQIEMSKLKGGRAGLMLKLQEKEIYTQLHYIPIYMQPYYQNYLKTIPVLPVAEAYYERCLSLPLFPSMNDSDPRYVVESLATVLRELWEE